MLTPTLVLKPQNMKDGSTKLKLSSPFHPGFPAKARALGGVWNSTTSAWYFDPRDVERVRNACNEVYGIDPLADEPAELVTVQVPVKELSDYCDDVWFAGRQILRYGKPVGRCAIVAGTVSYGGSKRHPYTAPSPDLLVEVRDVPRSKAEADIAAFEQKRESAIDGLNNSIAALDDPAKVAGICGMGQSVWDTSDPELQRQAIEKNRQWLLRLRAEEQEKLGSLRSKLRIVETLDPSLVIHEVQAAQPVPEPQPGELSQVDKLWAALQELSPRERAEIMGRILAEE